MLLLCSPMALLTIATGGNVSSAARKHQRKQEVIKAPHGFIGMRSLFGCAVSVCAEDDAREKKKTLSKLMSAIHFKGSSMNASGLYFSNVSENDVRGESLCRGPTDAGYFSKM